jgi:hypothetical protein
METAEPGAYCTIHAPASVVSIWTDGDERDRVVADGALTEAAHQLARRMGR